LRSARAARLPLVSLLLPEPMVPEEPPVLLLEELEPPLAPIVLPLPLGELLDEELVEGELAEPEEPVVEPEAEGVVAEPELEPPLAPIEVPLEPVLPLELGELAVELDVSVELEPLALGVLVEELPLGELADELLLGVVVLEEEEPAVLGLVVLELPEAPIELLVDGLVPEGLAPPAVPVLPLVPPVPALVPAEVPEPVPPAAPELCAMA
jgi:hypothetical protein